MCKQLGISHAAYYKWLHRTIPEQESENTKLAELIKEYDERFGHILGYRRMTSWINHFNHTSYSKNRVHRIMKKLREQGIEQSMSRVGHCIDNGPTEGLWGIIKSEMYCMYKITDEVSLRSAIDKYIKFYAEERLQERFHCKTPLEVRSEALSAETPTQYPIAENKRIEAYKAKWCA